MALDDDRLFWQRLSSIIGAGAAERRSTIPRAKRCAARNRNHPDNDNDNNNQGFRCIVAHRSAQRRGIGCRRAAPAPFCERAQPLPGSESHRTRRVPLGQ